MSNYIPQLLTLHTELRSNGVHAYELSELVFELLESSGTPDENYPSVELLEHLGLMSQLLWLLTHFHHDIEQVRASLASYLCQEVAFA